ncbi:MAG TPA: HAD-IIA family hydrolase [Verrucomicrobiota bacterium]|nr:HAD-IIA family hydrolase [Verrucomicrobiota bacterium]
MRSPALTQSFPEGTTVPRSSPPELASRLARIRHVALDMDGTIYRGKTLFEFTNPFLALLVRLGISYSFLTNNSSKSVRDYVAHLRAMGIDATADQIYTSTQATLEFLRSTQPSVKRLFVLGTRGMSEEVASAGYTLTADSAGDEPDAVLVGFDLGLTYARLCRAAYWIKRGKLFIASHPDRICPTDEPTVLVDCGSICAALREAAGRGPDAVLGKPDPRMLHGLLHSRNLRPENLAMVGDRLYTDMEMARRAGVLGVLVLTGEATAEEAREHKPELDLVATNLAELGNRLEAARKAGV